MFLSDTILFNSSKGRKIYSKNRVAKLLTINRFVIGIYKVYLVSRQIIIKIILYFLLLNVYDFNNFIMKSIEISCYSRFKIESIVNSL